MAARVESPSAWAEEIARFVGGPGARALPGEVARAARMVWMDCVGVTVAGAAEPASTMVQREVREAGCRGRCTVLGTRLRACAEHAAWANGVAAHALDFDDTSRSMEGHASVAVLPVVLALGERERRSGAELLTAFTLGFELQAKLGRVVGPRLRAAGWHSAGTLGTMGAALAAGYLMHLPEEQLVMALGIAASMASGLGANIGSMVKPLHAGNAARNGLIGARLARQGFTSQPQALSRFLTSFTAGLGADPGRLTEAVAGFGKPFDILSPGTDIKLYPSCNYTHPSIDAALAIVRAPGFSPDGIDRVDCTIGSRGRVLLRRPPRDGLEAKFSVEFCLAAALRYGDVGPERFTEAEIGHLAGLSARVQVTEQAPENGDPMPAASVTVRWQDGTRRTASVVHPRGSASDPVALEEVEGKYRKAVGTVLPPRAVEASLDYLRAFDRLATPEPLLELLRGEPEHSSSVSRTRPTRSGGRPKKTPGSR
jgi:2-methylcitrate dehydratase PrpD